MRLPSWLLGLGLLAVSASARTRASHDGYVDNHGVKLFYHMVGTGPDTLIVIHGGPGFTMDYFAKDLEPLAAHHTLLFYDQRGAGKSTLVADSVGLAADRFVDDLDAVRRHFRFRKVALLGHSWGAIIAAGYAARYPERVSRLLIVAGVPLTRQGMAGAIQTLASHRDSASAAGLKQWYEARVKDPGDTAACRAYYRIWFAPFFADPSALGRSKGDFCAGTEASRRNKIEHVDRYTAASLGAWDFRSQLRHFSAPTLVILGTHDIFPRSTGQEWASTVADGRLLVFPNAGHFLYLEIPDAFFGAVDTFLKGGWPEGATHPAGP